MPPTSLSTLHYGVCLVHNSLVYYGLTLNSGALSTNIYTNTIVLGLCEMPGYIFTYFMMDSILFGRKRSLIIGLLICTVSVTAIDIVDLTAYIRLVMGLFAKMMISSTFAIIFPYTCELFPTSIRSMSFGNCGMMSRVGGIIAPFASDVGKLIKPMDENPGFLVYSCVALLSTLLCVFLPETLNGNIYDTIASFKQSKRSNRDESDEEVQHLLVEDSD